MPSPATCVECGKTYRVPDPSRTYQCKACGGTVEANAPQDTDPAEPKEAERPSCPVCGALSTQDSRFCEECGSELEGDGAQKKAPITRRGRKRETDEVARTLRQSYKWIGFLRTFYGINAGVYSVLTLFSVLAYASMPESRGELGFGVAILTSLTIVMVVGTIQLPFQPFVWSIVLASLSTLDTTLYTANMLADGISPVFLAIRWVWTAAYWFGVSQTIQVRHLIRMHPELYIAKRIQGIQSKRRTRSQDPEQEKEMMRIAAKAAAKRAWIHSGIGSAIILFIVCVGCFSGGLAKKAPGDPPEIDRALVKFEKAWSASDPVGVAELFSKGASNKRISSIKRLAKRRDWSAYPSLGEPNLRTHSHKEAYVTYDLSAGQLSVSWKWTGSEWRIVGLTPPK